MFDTPGGGLDHRIVFVGRCVYAESMNINDAIDAGFDPSENYTPKPMSIKRYREWCVKEAITPKPDYGIYSDTPPF